MIIIFYFLDFYLFPMYMDVTYDKRLQPSYHPMYVFLSFSPYPCHGYITNFSFKINQLLHNRLFQTNMILISIDILIEYKT